MVKKLFKHEFLYYLRIMRVVYLILFTIAGAGRIIQFFEADSIPYEVVFDISCITYGVSVFGTFIFAFVLAVIRFYKNLFTSEGYLTHTLPVTPAQHIWVKAITAVCVQLLSILMILVSGCIITAGEMLVEIWNAMVFLLQELAEHTGVHGFIIGGEFFVFFVLSLFSSIMLYYTFISIGQLFKKNRILAAVGAYFVYYILSQIGNTILVVIFSVAIASGSFDAFGIWMVDTLEKHPYAVIHCFIWLTTLLPVVATAIEFLISRSIISRKLNLE